MSNDVYGYFYSDCVEKSSNFFNRVEELTNIGVTQITINELYNFPTEILPSSAGDCICFVVGDKPGKVNATYLVDFIDYADEADIGFPHEGKARLKILIDFLHVMMDYSKPSRFVVAMAECGQIESVKYINIDELEPVLFSDFTEVAPPDIAYCIDLR